MHSGLDFVAPAGKNVYATGDGIVTFVQYSRTGYGNEIVIDHRFGFGSRYAHLNQMKVKEGEKVKRGQLIGTVGETGRATGPHLHYEVLYENRPVNPSFYFDTQFNQRRICTNYKQSNKENQLNYIKFSAMGKIKYKFNPDSLSYYKVESSFKQKALKGLAYFFVFW